MRLPMRLPPSAFVLLVYGLEAIQVNADVMVHGQCKYP